MSNNRKTPWSLQKIELSSTDENRPLNLKVIDIKISNTEKKQKKYIPLSKRQDKPDSALWLLKQHSLLKDSQIAKLVGVTKNSVTAIRNKSYWNFNSLNPKDPVAIGLFSQKELVDQIEKAERRVKREKKLKEKAKISDKTNSNEQTNNYFSDIRTLFWRDLLKQKLKTTMWNRL